MSKPISKILVVLANPSYDIDNRANVITDLCKSFIEKMTKKGLSVDVIDLYKEDFDPIHDPEEKDNKSLSYQARIKKADLLVFFHPVWFASTPAILKGFIEKVFLPGFAFKLEKKIEKGLLSDKKALVFAVSEKPAWQYRYLYRDILKSFWQKAVFDPSGVHLIDLVNFGNLRNANQKNIEKWYDKIQKIIDKLNTKDSLLGLI